MTTATRLAALAAALLVLSLPLAAQSAAQGFDPSVMRQRMATQVDETVKALELEGETADKVREILMARVDKRMELFSGMRPGQGGNREAMQEAMAKLDEETTAQLGEILTEEQMKAWKAREAELRSRMRRGPRNQD